MLLSILAILSVLHQAYPLETTEQNKGENENMRLKLNTMKTMITNQQDICSNFNELDATTTSQPDTTTELPSTCSDALKQSGLQSYVHEISIPNSEMKPISVSWIEDPNKEDAPWTIIQRRVDGSVDFYRNWTDYQQGFGDLECEFFLGLDKIHALTQSTPHELWIQMEDFKNNTSSANYSRFAIGDASEAYFLKDLGKFSGDAGDSLRYHAGLKFSTPDMDNDEKPEDNCAILHKAAWWYRDCYYSNLNGEYLGAVPDEKYADSVVWYTWRNEYSSLKYVHMAIRPVSISK